MPRGTRVCLWMWACARASGAVLRSDVLHAEVRPAGQKVSITYCYYDYDYNYNNHRPNTSIKSLAYHPTTRLTHMVVLVERERKSPNPAVLVLIQRNTEPLRKSSDA
ncbi:hypothetical protein COCSADRAFT_192785 [Bipolaris sorokiniana ND90Pr]|uniref:Secreted protein n=1 Tax=Cochliobolus sativus (strain ND90Pr / ATCC 201652) TaxID=665912 RepID=M2S142_COCSN|nr:uncharacterized protein COCSADRAFT_192785 [Bipolaris sorokiniana ND90Pr]EMD60973.1 hypothetical protein COCSADRAFT_192785 [Bipolaris sorokiniana ND90Pr]